MKPNLASRRYEKPAWKRPKRPERPFGFGADTFSPYKEDDNWVMWVTAYVAKVEYIDIVRLQSNGLIFGEIGEPGADVWFLLRVTNRVGTKGMMLFNREVFYPVQTHGKETFVAGSFNSKNMRKGDFTVTDQGFLNKFTDIIVEKMKIL